MVNEGWAKLEPPVRKAFNERQVAFLKKKFEAGVANHKDKANSRDVSTEMMKAGFDETEWLTHIQIANFWSRQDSLNKAGKYVKATDLDGTIEQTLDDAAGNHEDLHDFELEFAEQHVVQSITDSLPPGLNSMFTGSIGDFVVYKKDGDLTAGRIMKLNDTKVTVSCYNRVAGANNFTLKQLQSETTDEISTDDVDKVITPLEENSEDCTATFSLPADWMPEFHRMDEFTNLTETPVLG